MSEEKNEQESSRSDDSGAQDPREQGMGMLAAMEMWRDKAYRLEDDLKHVKRDRLVVTIWLCFTLVALSVMGLWVYLRLLETHQARGEKATSRLVGVEAKLDGCREGWGEVSTSLESLSTVVMSTDDHVRRSLTPPECPPLAACPSPFDVQMQGQVDACEVQLKEIQMRWDAKYKLADEAIDAAKKLGVGPRLRDWIANDQAQLAAREVLLSYEDWAGVDRERIDMARECLNQMYEVTKGLDPFKRYLQLGDWRRSGENSPIWDRVKTLFPDWMRYRQMELDLTREAVGCLDEEPRGRGR